MYSGDILSLNDQTIEDFPRAKQECGGWPWDEPSQVFKAVALEKQPRITIVTPSLNQGKYIEKTIRSVILQRYSNLEYIIMDGGSTDQTIGIIKKYSKWIDYWESTKDRGQAHAINKGWALATGEIIAWLNSDDILMPNALHIIAHEFTRRPESLTISGSAEFHYTDTGNIETKRPQIFDLERYIKGGPSPGQPAVFINKSVFDIIGQLDETLRYSMDRDYWVRISLKCPEAEHIYLPDVLARAEQWGENKLFDSSLLFYEERRRLFAKAYEDSEFPAELKHFKTYTYATIRFAQALQERRFGSRFHAVILALKVLRFVHSLRSCWTVFKFCIKSVFMNPFSTNGR